MTKKNILEILAREGHAISKKRLCIIDALWEKQGVDDIENFWLSVRQKESIGLATVHQTLGILEYLGCITKLSGIGRKKRYQLRFIKNTD